MLVNMVDVARSLARPPTYVTKYFGCELGAQTQSDVKNERYIVNGCHEAGKLQDMLDGFIRKFVLCEQCENPETVIKVSFENIPPPPNSFLPLIMFEKDCARVGY